MIDFLTINELSEFLKIKKSSLYAKVERKEIPYYKIGHLVRFEKSEIELWLQRAKCDPKKKNHVHSKRKVRKNGMRKAEVDRVVKKAIDEQAPMPYTPSLWETRRDQGPERRSENGYF